MFRDFLRRRLHELDINQSDLANLLTLRGQPTSKQAVSHWINGRYEPPLKSASFRSALAASLEMDVQGLMAAIGYAPLDSSYSAEARRGADIIEQMDDQGRQLAIEYLELLERHFGEQ